MELHTFLEMRYQIVAVILFCIGFATLFLHPNLIKKIIGLNLMDAAVFLMLAAVGYVDGLMREIGIACDAKLDIYSSDSIPFADKGVPAINLCRFGAPGANYIHDRRDNLKSKYIDERALDITLQQALCLTDRVANAAAFPISRDISPEIKTKVDEYLFKTPKKNEK